MILQNKLFRNSFTGFVLYDPLNSEDIININGNKLFTPASNTKIFTFLAATSILKDSISALKYYISGDSLIFMGTGNPSVMNNDLPQDNTIVDFLKARKEKLYYSDSNFQDQRFGDGWAWDDYLYHYQVEKSPLPVYKNILYVWYEDESIYVDPEIFRNKIVFTNDSLISFRKYDANEFSIGVFDKGKVLRIPIKTDRETIVETLGYITGKEISRLDDNPIDLKDGKILMQPGSDSLYIRLLHNSDNFIAEQLLLMCSFMLFDTMNTRKAIDFSISEFMPYLTDSCRWVDGSGLSRYNLFSPNSIIMALHQIWERFGLEGIRVLFPEILMAQSELNKGAVYAKTGTLSNNFNISGYIITNQSNIYLFSFMVNHFTGSNMPIRVEAQKILRFVIDNY
jgi:D-alanyl-D-alanine carboxypeptidase/D-alanyl-D-alanine-endopeptidase (penicillin-binding protein 4)